MDEMMQLYRKFEKRKFPTNQERLQELRDAGYDCSLVKSVIVKKCDIKAGMLLSREEVMSIMGGRTSP